ncbi:hypothetical protein HCDG_09021 [Histoplasma capsulatum H143]|uniref:Uncharacterized protein n=1 Tax=Ajellomyces capsulatus (strain H143) TaxID=544712 RepID=C6HS40_AJECH|nr:hypothetical protein HCDG_09021 [Histoplasma capsulatum H143]
MAQGRLLTFENVVRQADFTRIESHIVDGIIVSTHFLLLRRPSAVGHGSLDAPSGRPRLGGSPFFSGRLSGRRRNPRVVCITPTFSRQKCVELTVEGSAKSCVYFFSFSSPLFAFFKLSEREGLILETKNSEFPRTQVTAGEVCPSISSVLERPRNIPSVVPSAISVRVRPSQFLGLELLLINSNPQLTYGIDASSLDVRMPVVRDGILE